MSDEGQKDQLVLEAGASPALVESVKQFSKTLNLEEDTGIKVVPNPDEPVSATPEVEMNLDEEQKPEEKKTPETTETEGEDDQTEAPDEPGKIKVTFRGKDRELTQNDVAAALGRAESNQKKAEQLSNSDEYKLGVIAKAAKDGDKGAQKKLQQMLIEFTGAGDADGLTDNLDEVKPDFDEDKVMKDNASKQEWDDAFSDVSEGVDFQKNLDIVSSDLKGRMPAKVFDTFWNRPDTRRTMYDLVAVGRMDEVMDAFDQNLEKLPFADQLEIERDPDQWGSLFAKTVRTLNAQSGKAASTEEKAASNTDDGSGSQGNPEEVTVSSGNRGRTPRTAQDEGTPDFDRMTPQEFRAWKIKHNLPV